MAQAWAWPSFGSRKYDSSYSDLESGLQEDPALRWSFIRKVYGILTSQVLLTLASAAVVIHNHRVHDYILGSPWIILISAIMPFILLCALSAYYQQHPLNLILLSLFSLTFSVTLGMSCAFLSGDIVLEALLITALVTVSLTVFTFYAAEQGHDFEFLGPALFTSLMVLLAVTFLQLFFPMGSIGRVIIAAGGALIFSLYIVYDTSNLIRRFSYDEYIWASLALYLDVMNLFTFVLELLSYSQGNE